MARTNGSPQFPFHTDSTERLRKVNGQVQGIQHMIEERRYCLDILQQVTAARRGLDEVALQIVRGHINSCVRQAIQKKRGGGGKIEELMQALHRIMR